MCFLEQSEHHPVHAYTAVAYCYKYGLRRPVRFMKDKSDKLMMA